MSKAKLSKPSQKALHTFDLAAQSHGWESDQGSERNADFAQVHYDRAKDKLEKRIIFLETKIKYITLIAKR